MNVTVFIQHEQIYNKSMLDCYFSSVQVILVLKIKIIFDCFSIAITHKLLKWKKIYETEIRKDAVHDPNN